MIVYWIELWCDGCKEKYHPRPVTLFEEIPRNREWLLEMAAGTQGWIADGTEHFCPNCQIQRKAG